MIPRPRGRRGGAFGASLWLSPRRLVVASLLATALGARAEAAATELAVQPHLGQLDKDGFVVAFETREDALVRLEVARPGSDAGAAAFEVMAEDRGQRHRLRASRLRPGERVRWRLVSGAPEARILADGAAQTAPPDDATTLDFLVYGDTRSDEASERNVILTAAAGAPLFALHTGDLVPSGDDEDAWRRLFEVEQPLLGEVPMFLALGNHELYRDPEATRVRRFLPLPIDPEPGSRTYYTFRVGPARFVALDSNRLDDEQATWLARVLSDAEHEPGHPHVFVFMHHPPFSMGGHCGSAVEQAAWITLFERHRPTAVFAGHDHAYQRLERNGVRYFITGGGGAPLYGEQPRCPEHDRLARRAYVADHHVLRVRLRGEAIEVEAARPSGGPIEVVRWSRGEAGAEGPAIPAIVDERKPSGLLRPMVATVSVAALAGLLVLVARRRRR